MARGKKDDGKTPISNRKKQLDHEQELIRLQEAKLKEMLENAPQKRQKLVKQQRDEYVKDKARPVNLDGSGFRRYDLHSGRTTKSRRTRNERSGGFILFVLLIIALGVSLYYSFRILKG